MGGILTMHQFLDAFPDINPNAAVDDFDKAHRSETQGISVAAYNLGCFMGAIATIFISIPSVGGG